MHGPLGQQRQDGGADIATPAATATSRAAPSAARTETEAAAGIEAELEAASRTEAGLKARAEGAGLLLAEIAAGLAALLMKGPPVARAEAEASGWWCEWVAHVCGSLFRTGNAERVSDTLTIYRKLS